MEKCKENDESENEGDRSPRTAMKQAFWAVTQEVSGGGFGNPPVKAELLL